MTMSPLQAALECLKFPEGNVIIRGDDRAETVFVYPQRHKLRNLTVLLDLVWNKEESALIMDAILCQIIFRRWEKMLDFFNEVNRTVAMFVPTSSSDQLCILHPFRDSTSENEVKAGVTRRIIFRGGDVDGFKKEVLDSFIWTCSALWMTHDVFIHLMKKNLVPTRAERLRFMQIAHGKVQVSEPVEKEVKCAPLQLPPGMYLTYKADHTAYLQ